MVLQSLENFDDGYGEFDETGAQVEEPEGFSSLVEGADAILLEDNARNERQARRNLRIRGLLKTWRDSSENEPKPLKMDELAKVAKKAPMSEHPPWLVFRDEPIEVSLRLHEELLDFADFMRPTVIEAAMRHAWVHSLEEAAQSLWPEVQVHVFGSTSTNLNLPTADIDVAIVNVKNLRTTTAMKQLAERLLERQEVSKIEIIQSARVPVMKVQQRSTGLMADIIMNRSDGMETANFVREQMAIFPALSPLVLFLKLFLAQRGLHETYQGGLGSYLLVCVVLAFLQQHPAIGVGPGAGAFARPQSMTLGKLLLDFFRYYGQEFRYAVTGISVLNGGCLFDRQQRGWTARTRNGQPTICLESPVEPGTDIGTRVFKIGIIRAAFNHGYHILSSLFLSKEPIRGSLLCPFLLRRDHPLIVQRYRLFEEQPAPFLELVGRPESDDERQPQEPITKKKRTTAPLEISVAMEAPEEPAEPVEAPETAEEYDPFAEPVADAPEEYDPFEPFEEQPEGIDNALDFLSAADTVGIATDDAVETAGIETGDVAADAVGMATDDGYGDGFGDGYGDADGAAALGAELDEELLDLDPDMLAEEQRLLQEQIRLLEEEQLEL